MDLVNSPQLSPLTSKQYDIQLNYLLQGAVAQMEFLMFPFGGLADLVPIPNGTYISIISGLMVRISLQLQCHT